MKRAASRIAAQGAAVYLANSSLISLLASALVSWSSSSSSSASTLALTSVSICLAVDAALHHLSWPMSLGRVARLRHVCRHSRSANDSAHSAAL